TDHESALKVHLAHELGMDVEERPSPIVAAVSSLVSFSIGALIPIIPFFFAFGTLWWGLLFGAVGLILAGSSAAIFTKKSPFVGGLRQLLYGGIAVVATYSIGSLLNVSTFG